MNQRLAGAPVADSWGEGALADPARAYAVALAKTSDLDTMLTLRTMLDGVFEELRVHRSYAERWGADLDAARTWVLRPGPDGRYGRYGDGSLRLTSPLHAWLTSTGGLRVPTRAVDEPEQGPIHVGLGTAAELRERAG